MKAKKGFTLVEVFLTLGIIGVIAAITIPTMIHYTNKKATIEQLKKTAATLNHAVYNAVVTNSDVANWNWRTEGGIQEIMQNVITPRLNVGYMCSGDVGLTNRVCNYKIKGLNDDELDITKDFKTATRVLLNDGAMIAFSDGFTLDEEEDGTESSSPTGDPADEKTVSECAWTSKPNSNATCGIFLIDVNGAQKPNTIGKDVFFYALHLSGSVLPYGANRSDEFIEENCSKNSGEKTNGKTCAAKIINGGWDVCYSCENPYPVIF